MGAAPAQRLAFFPQPEQAGLVKVRIPLRVSLSREGRPWGEVAFCFPACWLVQQVGVSCWTLPFCEEQDKKQRCITLVTKKTSVSGSSLVGETRQHQRGAGTETDNPSGQGERVSLSTEQEIQSNQTDLLRAILRASTLKTCDCITHIPFLR